MLIIVLVILLALLMSVKWAFENNVLLKEINNSELDGLNIFFISDIHRRKINDTFISKIKQHKIDFVFIGGDLAEGKVPLERIDSNVKKLTQLAPTFFVMGNNDYELDFEELTNIFDKYGVMMLTNESVKLSWENSELCLIGLDELNHSREKLETVLTKEKVDTPYNILLCHNPIVLNYVVEQDPIDLILCGHTHGGQIRFGPIGLYKHGAWETFKNKLVLVSNGYGTTLLPMRFGAKAQTHIIKLKKLN